MTALAALFMPIMLVHGEPIVRSVDSTEQTGWLRWLIPLPREISITEKVEVEAADVQIRVRESARAPIVDHPVAMCFSKPRSGEILAEWIASLAGQGVPAVNVWLSEYGGQCGCDECRKAAEADRPQHVLEALAVWKALPEARKHNPKLQLRILTTQGSYPSNGKIVRNLPREVGIEYYCGVGCPYSTYDSSRDPMIYPLLADYASKGNWLGVYSQFTPSYGMVAPWSAPEFIKFRMTEYSEKKLKSVCGYVLPNNALYDFNVTAAAEWAWNARGRSPREFSAAWATRKGLVICLDPVQERSCCG